MHTPPVIYQLPAVFKHFYLNGTNRLTLLIVSLNTYLDYIIKYLYFCGILLRLQKLQTFYFFVNLQTTLVLLWGFTYIKNSHVCFIFFTSSKLKKALVVSLVLNSFGVSKNKNSTVL